MSFLTLRRATLNSCDCFSQSKHGGYAYCDTERDFSVVSCLWLVLWVLLVMSFLQILSALLGLVFRGASCSAARDL